MCCVHHTAVDLTAPALHTPGGLTTLLVGGVSVLQGLSTGSRWNGSWCIEARIKTAVFKVNGIEAPGTATPFVSRQNFQGKLTMIFPTIEYFFVLVLLTSRQLQTGQTSTEAKKKSPTTRQRANAPHTNTTRDTTPTQLHKLTYTTSSLAPSVRTGRQLKARPS